MKIAAVQMRSGSDPYENLLFVDACVAEAVQAGCDLVCFPENVFYRGPRSADGFDRSDYFLTLNGKGELDASTSDFAAIFNDFISSWPITVSLGSVYERSPDNNKPYNSHWLIAPGGHVVAYRKIHLFDYNGAEVKYCESDDFKPGHQPVGATLTSRHNSLTVKIGLSICFDLRFPELYRDLVLRQQARVLLIPAAFTFETGIAHWDVLLRARAIENFSFVVASGQWGSHKNAKGQELFCFGRTQIIGPWGDVLAVADNEGDALVVAEIDIEHLQRLRSSLPALSCVKLYK